MSEQVFENARVVTPDGGVHGRPGLADGMIGDLAAETAREAGMRVVMGGLNVIVGGSHSGNVAAEDLAGRGLLDDLSSDYVPLSLLRAAFRLHDRLPWRLERAIDLVSGGPARMIGLADRGALAPGRRADRVRVRRAAEVAAVVVVWSNGRRVA